MTYATDTVSISGSAPVELYEFITATVTYQYTSFDTDFTYSAQTYVALKGLSRAAVEVTAADMAQEMEVTMPASTDFIQLNIFGKLPRSITCRIRRLERVSAEARIIWEGPVTAIRVNGRSATVLVPSKMDDALDTEIPTVRFQPVCNHFLYDARCRITASLHDLAVTVVSVVGTTITLTGVAGAANQYYRAGEIVRAVDGERRLVVDQTGAVLKINYPFRELAPAEVLTLFEGCDHTIKTCRDKFINWSNFGGHPNIGTNFVSLQRLLMGKS